MAVLHKYIGERTVGRQNCHLILRIALIKEEMSIKWLQINLVRKLEGL